MIGDLASELRLFLEPQWQEWKSRTGRGSLPETASASMCGFTSAFLAEVLPDLAGAEWCMVGGAPASGGGVCGSDLRLHPHFWAVSSDGILVDLTGDQFGLPSPVVARRGDRRYIESFDTDYVDRHLPRVMPLVEEWIELAADDGLLPMQARLAA